MNLMLCSHGNPSVTFIIVSCLAKKDPGPMKRNPGAPMGFAGAWRFLTALLALFSLGLLGKAAPSSAMAPRFEQEVVWD